MLDKKPTHVTQRQASGKRNKPLRSRRQASEFYDVFRRINMHDGDKLPCWEWDGAHGVGSRGDHRPRVIIGGRDYYVYRIVYMLYTGYKLEKNEVVRHNCDNSWCCNPHHMVMGTQADNVRDMLERERVGLKMFHVKRIMQMLEMGCSAVYVKEKMKQGYDLQLDVSVIRKIRMRTVYKHIEWPWGDKWAADRRARLKAVRAAK